MESAELYIKELFKDLVEYGIYYEDERKFATYSTYYKKNGDLVFEYFKEENTFFYSSSVKMEILERFGLKINTQKKLIKTFVLELLKIEKVKVDVEFYWDAENVKEQLRKKTNYLPRKVKRTLE